MFSVRQPTNTHTRRDRDIFWFQSDTFNVHAVLTQTPGSPQEYKCVNTGMLTSPYPNLLPDVFCLMVRIFRLMLVLLYIYK